jgi:opacity protein-like surface antigen
MNRIFLTTASILALTVLALPAFAQSYSAAGNDPYGYGNVPMPPPMPAYQAQQAATSNYTPLSQYAPQYATSSQTMYQPVATAQYGVVPNYLPAARPTASYQAAQTVSYPAPAYQASTVGYSVQANASQLPAVASQYAAPQATQYATQAATQYGTQAATQYVTGGVPQQATQYAAPAYAAAQDVTQSTSGGYAPAGQQYGSASAPSYQSNYQPAYQQGASITAAPMYDAPTQVAAGTQQQYVTQAYAQQPQVQTYTYGSQQAAPAQQYYTTSQPLTVTEQKTQTAQAQVEPSRDVSLATDPSVGPWYYTLRSGLTIPSNSNFTFGGKNVETEYQTGWQLGTGVGYEFKAFNNWLAPRAELELVYDQQLVDSHNVGGAKTSDPNAYGFVRSLDLMANGFLDFRLNRILSPYIGGGVGAGYSDFDRMGTSAAGVIMDDNDVGFVWQAMGGMGISLNNSSTIDIGYRYLQNTGLTLKARDGSTSTTDLSKHVFMIGFRNNF